MAITVDHAPAHAAPHGWPWLEKIRQAGRAEVLSGNAGQVVRRVAWVVVVLAALAVVVFTAPILWGYRPTLGRSMEPTLPALGGFCKLEKLADPMGQLRPNDIVVVDGGTLGYSVKRVARIDPAQGLYLLGDNIDRSMDSSFGADGKSPNRDVWVPFDELKGRVTNIWSPERAWRSRTAEGRYVNAVEFMYNPRTTTYGPRHAFVAKAGDKWVVVEGGRRTEITAPVSKVEWRAGRLYIESQKDSLPAVFLWDGRMVFSGYLSLPFGRITVSDGEGMGTPPVVVSNREFHRVKLDLGRTAEKYEISLLPGHGNPPIRLPPGRKKEAVMPTATRSFSLVAVGPPGTRVGDVRVILLK